MKKYRRMTILFLLIGILLAGIKTVYAEQQVITTIQDIFYIPAVAMEIHGDKNVITDAIGDFTFWAYTDEGEMLELPVSWNMSAVNVDLLGAYTIYGTPMIPDGYRTAEDTQIPKVETMVSVQSVGKPDINACSIMKSAGLFYFPWLYRADTEDMEAWLKKDGGDWVNITENEFAICDSDGLYMSNQAIVPGNLYHLAVTYEEGMSRTLNFWYGTDRSFEIRSYENNWFGGGGTPKYCISSFEQTDEKIWGRVMAYAVSQGSSLEQVRKDLEESIILLASTADEFENSAENPSIVLSSKWDLTEADTGKTGVYRVQGAFQIPEGYTLKEGVELPKPIAYISVQKTGELQIQTFFVHSQVLTFPMVMDEFSAEQLAQFSLYLKEDDGEYQKVKTDAARFGITGMDLEAELFREDHSYEMYVEYPGGSTGVYSFIYDDSYIINDSWYERNFSDREGNTLPDIVQGEKKSETENPDNSDANMDIKESSQTEEESYVYAAGIASYTVSGGTTSSGTTASGGSTGSGSINNEIEKESVTETVTEITTVVSGQRMQVLLEDAGDEVIFEKNGISLAIPDTVIRGWKLEADSEVKITIQKISEIGFSVRVFVNREEVTELAGAHAKVSLGHFSKELSPGNISVVNTSGEECESIYQPEQNILRVSLNGTGDFFMEAAGEQEEDILETDGQEIFEEEYSEEMLEDTGYVYEEEDDEIVEIPEEDEEMSEEEPPVKRVQFWIEKYKKELLAAAAAMFFLALAAMVLVRRKRR